MVSNRGLVHDGAWNVPSATSFSVSGAWPGIVAGVSVVLRVAYDGTDFHGFARQPGVRTVQGRLEAAVSQIYKQPVLVRGASRTDAGVHARGQIVAFDPPFEIPVAGIAKGVGAGLSRDLVVSAAWTQAGRDGGPLQPRRENLGKHYRYRIRTGHLPEPFEDRQVWHHPRGLDAEAMRAAAELLVGEHDFASFRAGDCQAESTVRELFAIDIGVAPTRLLERGADPEAFSGQRAATEITIDVRGSAFLKNMVRILVGTLVDVGTGRRAPQYVESLFEVHDRQRAGATAPALGLCLEEVLWPGRR